MLQLLISQGADVNIRDIDGHTPLDCQDEIDNAKYLIEHCAINGKIHMYKYFQYLFSEKQQNAFDSFLLLTNDDNEFFHMCLSYQNNQKNNVKIDIKDMDIQ